MNRFLLLCAAAVPLLADASLKGAALLALAGLCALLMRGSSAAARHMVWLAAVVALMALPLLAFLLPGWRVLPKWAAPGAAAAGSSRHHTPDRPYAAHEADTPPSSMEQRAVLPPAPPLPAPANLPAPEPRTIPQPAPLPAAPATAAAPLTAWLLPLWAAGCGVLLIRLAAAHFLLRRNTRRCEPATGPLAAAFEAAREECGVGQPVRVLMDNARTIPVVWGVFRPQLLLPGEAENWDDTRLRSVLLHELAHLRRRDPLTQLLTQLACALHWFNPLVWLAAWRLHVERERACDDLVLSRGVKPSAYAEHLLHIATQLSPARWTQACGLAMARKSSLEGRLLAVLSDKLNRRRVTRTLAAAAILLSTAIAVPVAMLSAAPEKASAPSVLSVLSSGRLAPETLAKLKWGEPVNGLRMALAFPPALKDSALGDDPYFKFVIQNASDKEVHYFANESAPNPRKMLWREDERIVQALSDEDASPADVRLQPGECVVLRLFTEEQRSDGGKTISELLEGDLAGGPRYHAIATMEITNAPAGAWTGKLTTGRTRGSADIAAAPVPTNKDAHTLYKVWQRHTRANGDIPGALIGELAGGVNRFIRYNPTWETVPKLNAILTKLDANRDWKPAEAIALLDEIAAVQDSPLSMVLGDQRDRVILSGKPLPKELADQKWLWSQRDASGLRLGWDLQPRGQPSLMEGKAENWISAVPAGTALGAKLFVHNTGDKPIVLRVPTWHQGDVTAAGRDAKSIDVSGISWTTIAQLAAYRLAPGEYVTINAPGVGFGKEAGNGPWAGPRVGWNLEPQPGDQVRLEHAAVPFDGSAAGRREDSVFADGPNWWHGFLVARLARGLPLPADATERARLLDRAMQEIFQSAPTAEEREAFAKVDGAKALSAFAQKLTERPGLTSFAGKLGPVSAWFNVTAADPADASRPRVVLNPGGYPIGGATLKIVGRTDGDRYIYDTKILFAPDEATGARAPEPHKVEMPEASEWAIVCRPGEGAFYILNKGAVRKIDFTNPRQVTDTPATDLPAGFRNEVKRQLDIHGVSAEQQAEIFEKSDATPSPRSEEKPKGADTGKPTNTPYTVQAPGKCSDAFAEHSAKVAQARQMQQWKADDVIAWGEEKDGLRSGVVMEQRAPRGTPLKTWLVIRNVSAETKEFTASPVPNRIDAQARAADGSRIMTHQIWLTGIDPTYKIVLKPGETLEFPGVPVVCGLEKNADGSPKAPAWPACGFETSEAKVFIRFPLQNVNGPETGEVEVEITQARLTTDTLLGAWRGTVNGEKLMLSFHRPPAEKDVRCDIYFGDATIGALAGFTIAADGSSAEVVQHSAGGGMKFGTLIPDESGKLKLELYGRQVGQQETMLTRDPEAAATEPRQKEARELFEIWKGTANADGTIPGTFIGMLATEVRAYVKANPTLDSAVKLPMLLPRFVTSRDWTHAEALKLLDDVAYYSTEPITARVAKAKLPSGPLWRTTVEFQDIPVQIEKWSEAKDGLRIGLRVVEADWRIGGRARVEFWLHNAGEMDVTFKTTGPDGHDSVMAVAAIDAEGREHGIKKMRVLNSALPMDCVLSAGHVAMAKQFVVPFWGEENKSAAGFHDLKPGKYQLRCHWTDANPMISRPGDWTGVLTAPDFAFTLSP